jgi:hypothetical protein
MAVPSCFIALARISVHGKGTVTWLHVPVTYTIRTADWQQESTAEYLGLVVLWTDTLCSARQCTCNVTMRRVRVTFVAVEKQ